MISLNLTIDALRALEVVLPQISGDSADLERDSITRAVSKTILDEPVETDDEGRAE
jgi:hypothetical protein